MAGVKGKSGRKPKLKEGTQFQQQKAIEAQEALRRIQIFAKDVGKGIIDIKAWLDANKYVYEVEYGRPTLSVDQRIKGQILITPDMRALAAREMIETKEEETRLLGAHYNYYDNKDEPNNK